MPAWKQRLGDLGVYGRGRRPFVRRLNYRRPYGYRGAMYGRAAARSLVRKFPFQGRAYALRRATGALRTTNWNRPAEELKYLDINMTAYNCTNVDAAGVTLINGVAAGSTAITREGRQCFWKSVSITGKIAPVDATIIRQRCDVYVIWDWQPGTAVPDKTAIFVEAISGSPLNLNNRERFLVVAHETYVIGGLFAAGEALTPTIQAVTIQKKINLRTTFKGDNNAIGDIATGAMYLVCVGDQAAAECATLTASVRLRFAER